MADIKIKQVDPLQAQEILQQNPYARLFDVRSKVEFDYVGHPLGAIHVPWKEFPQWQENTKFVESVTQALTNDGAADNDRPLLMICRSGARSLQAGERLMEHGYTDVYNVEEGFEGDKDDHQHRGNINGWRFHGLAWEQG